MSQFFSLDGKVALVTGASRGIGAGIAKRLAQAGATVIINYRGNKEAADKVLSEIKPTSPKSVTMAFNVSEPSEVDKAIDEIIKNFGELHIVVANAGISKDTLLLRATAEVFEEVIRTNLMGTVNVVRAACRPMMKNRYGRIICMSSVVGEMGNKGQSPYAASKSAIFGFARSVALELGSRQITCNVVCPGFIETEMTGALDPQAKELYMNRTAVQKFGTVEDVASLVHFLSSEESGYITGSILDINGGLYMR